jgi:hypothetical protein
MFRRLDIDRVWQLAAEQGLTPAALARRAGLGPARDLLLRLTGLEDLSAVQLVGLADVLGVTVEELLTGPSRPGTDGPAPAGTELLRRRPEENKIALAAALLRFGDLAQPTLLEVFGWTSAVLNQTIAAAQRALEPSGLTVRRVCGRIELAAGPHSLPPHVSERLTTRIQEHLPLDPEEASHLALAVRAHLAGPFPGPPWTPWPVADSLARQGAAAPIDRRHPGRPVRLIPHPDLLFALHLTTRPSPGTQP